MIGYQYENCFFYIDVGYNPVWAKFSVGSVLQWEVMEDLYRRDDTPALFDFSTGYGTHKSRFGKESREEVNMLLLPTTLSNRALAATWRSVDGVLDLTSRTLDNFGLKQSVKKAIRGIKVGKRVTAASQTTEHNKLGGLVDSGGGRKYLRLARQSPGLIPAIPTSTCQANHSLLNCRPMSSMVKELGTVFNNP